MHCKGTLRFQHFVFHNLPCAHWRLQLLVAWSPADVARTLPLRSRRHIALYSYYCRTLLCRCQLPWAFGKYPLNFLFPIIISESLVLLSFCGVLLSLRSILMAAVLIVPLLGCVALFQGFVFELHWMLLLLLLLFHFNKGHWRFLLFPKSWRLNATRNYLINCQPINISVALLLRICVFQLKEISGIVGVLQNFVCVTTKCIIITILELIIRGVYLQHSVGWANRFGASMFTTLTSNIPYQRICASIIISTVIVIFWLAIFDYYFCCFFVTVVFCSSSFTYFPEYLLGEWLLLNFMHLPIRCLLLLLSLLHYFRACFVFRTIYRELFFDHL